MQTVGVSTDVLVVGGGTAGCLAAMRASETGADVAVIEKGGSISRSGSCASGMDHYSVLLDEAPWDTPEGYLASLSAEKAKPQDLKVAEVYARNSKKVFQYLENIGMPFKDKVTGKYQRIAGLGGNHPRTVSFEGAAFKPILARQVHRLQARVLERVAVQGLLTESGRVIGAVGFHIRSGDFFVIKAKAVVITTGGAVRFYPAPSGHNFITHTPPFNTGDGQAMAFRAGAALTNMEFTSTSAEPKGFSAPGLTGFVSCGARLVNAKGEYFMKRYHPLAEHGPRHLLVKAIKVEADEGRGPCYFDCRHLPPNKIEFLLRGFRNEKVTLIDLFAAQGIDLTRDLVPFEPREFDCNGNGIVIDETCRSSLEGLFSAGNCSSASLALPGACTLGYIAGEKAAEEASRVKTQPPPGREQIAEYREAIFRPLDSRGGLHPTELEDALRQVMHEFVGFERNAEGLRTALERLNGLREKSRDLTAHNMHELLRANEARNLIEVSLLIAAGTLRRASTQATPWDTTSYRAADKKQKGGFILITASGDKGATLGPPSDWKYREAPAT
ncbi:MAG: FAD-dependent oxidoreductase [Dehalococcoidia bacterium]|nr:FAD-dependent oxidoreductase [Dehalococcoidia bacterium]